MISIKIFVETTVLIAASIYSKGGKYHHKQYSDSKSLFNFFKENIAKQAGFTSDTVINQAWMKLEKAINDVINESNEQFENNVVRLDLISGIKDDAEDRLAQNIKVLGKYPIDDSKVEKILKEEVSPFYKDFKNELKTKGEFVKYGLRLKKSTLKMIARMNKPYFKGIPDSVDKTILAEAIYIKRTFLNDEEICLASLDTDFSPAKKDSFLRDKVNDDFRIYCGWPAEIFSRAKQSHSSK